MPLTGGPYHIFTCLTSFLFAMLLQWILQWRLW